MVVSDRMKVGDYFVVKGDLFYVEIADGDGHYLIENCRTLEIVWVPKDFVDKYMGVMIKVVRDSSNSD